MTRKHTRGFTIVELIVTIVIFTILTTLVVVRLSMTQASGRDQEREIDVETIATGLDLYYQSGSPDGSISKGYYPGATQIQSAVSSSPPFNAFLEGVSQESFEAPERTITTSFGIDPNYASSPAGANADGSYSDAQARALLSTYPYLYQPLMRDNTFCTTYTKCVRFNLYYLEESSDTVKLVRSKNQ